MYKLVYTNGDKTFYTENGLDSVVQHIRDMILEDEEWIIKTACSLHDKCMTDYCMPSQFILRLTSENFLDPLLEDTLYQ